MTKSSQKPASDAVPQNEPIGVRVSEPELISATEHAAIIAERYLGHGIEKWGNGQAAGPGNRRKTMIARRQATVRREIYASLLGELQGACCTTNIRFAYRPNSEVEDLMASRHSFGRWPEYPDHWYRELVVAPIEGVRGLINGYSSGAVSAVAAGPAGSFHDPLVSNGNGPEQRYFVLAAGREAELREDFLPPQGNPGKGPMALAEFLKKHDPVKELLRTANPDRLREVTIGTMDLEQPKCVQQFLRGRTKLRSFFGSSVAGALAVCLPEYSLDGYAAVLGLTETILIAVISLATGGEFFAVPVKPVATDKKPRRRDEHLTREHVLDPGAKVFRQKDFIRSNDVFTIITGVTTSLPLSGIHFIGDNMAVTDTVNLHVGDHSYRRIAHHQDVGDKDFPFYNYERSDIEHKTYKDLLSAL